MRLAAVVIPCILATASAALAREIVPAERREDPWEAALPRCEDTAVLEAVASRFATKESLYWNSPLRIVGYERIRPIGWRPWGLDFIPQRFCSAVAVVSDGIKRRVDYSVQQDGGLIGLTWGVQLCVVGLDRDWTNAPACKMARP